MHNVRWLIRKDLPEVLEIEKLSFEFPWTEEEFKKCLGRRECIGMVVELDEAVAGYMIYELHKTRLHVLNLAVHPDVRRQGIGSRMVDKLIGKLSFQRRNRMLLEVRETNLHAQLFLKKHGFRAIEILKSFYEDSTEDAYLMQFRVGSITAAEVDCAMDSFGL